jgi:hypothetical protein
VGPFGLRAFELLGGYFDGRWRNGRPLKGAEGRVLYDLQLPSMPIVRAGNTGVGAACGVVSAHSDRYVTKTILPVAG